MSLPEPSRDHRPFCRLKTKNPINGTVVDRGVTRPIYWDFYLQAQAPLQGSTRSAHYVVIHDEIFDRGVTRPIYWDFYLQAQPICTPGSLCGHPR